MAKPAAQRRGFPVVLTLFTLLAFVVLVGLGAWQVQRLKWKEDLLARIAELQSAPARKVGDVLQARSRGEDVDFTRVGVRCTGLQAAPYLQLYGLKDGAAGVRLVSACQLPDGPYGSILIDRGFISDEVADRPAIEASRTVIEVVGILRSPDRASFVTPPNEVGANRWYSRDVTAMARALEASRPAPVFLMAETSTNPSFRPLQPAPVPADIPNRHLEYAGTWFGLAGALLAVYAAMLFRRLRGQAKAG